MFILCHCANNADCGDHFGNVVHVGPQVFDADLSAAYRQTLHQYAEISVS